MAIRFNKHSSHLRNVEMWATTADTQSEVETIAAKLQKKGFVVTITEQPLWFDISGTRPLKTEVEIAADCAQSLRAPCGTGCGFSSY